MISEQKVKDHECGSRRSFDNDYLGLSRFLPPRFYQMKILALFACSIIFVGCEQQRVAPLQKKEIDHFERKIRCYELAQKAEKERQDNKAIFGFRKIIYSPVRKSCVVSSSYTYTQGDFDFHALSIEDLLSGDDLFSYSCSLKKYTCGDMARNNDKVEKMLSDLEQEPK